MDKITPRVFSGVQPTGHLHLGNYLGAIRNFVALQHAPQNYECLYCVVDLHAITAKQEPHVLKNNTRAVAAAFLAAGIDSKTHIIFNQSQVAAHSELAWIFACIARLGWLERMTQFKDKSGKHRERAAVGLYIYPILMAADILLYRATHVPVGEDQKQHLELARDIAQKFNHDFATDFFPQPEPLIQNMAARVMSLRDGTQKMSKSDASDMSRINLTDDADLIVRKIRKAKSDTDVLPATLEAAQSRPEAYNLLSLLAALEDKELADIVRDYAGGQFSVLKTDLIDACLCHIVPLGDTIRRYMAEPDYIDNILRMGAERAHERARPVMDKTREIIGFLHN